jgi:hypothetical protein
MKVKKLIGTLDRVEGNTAIIIVGEEDGTLDITRSLLPEGSKEGDILSIKIEKKEKKTLDEKERVEGLIKKLSSDKN